MRVCVRVSVKQGWGKGLLDVFMDNHISKLFIVPNARLV